MSRELKLATRGSALARWQTAQVKARLGGGVETIIETRGDVDQAPVLAGRMEKGFFTAELERALHEKTVDVAVHSLKDLPTAQPKGLCVGAVMERADPRDWLIVRKDAVREGATLPVKAGGRIGASSLRRMALIRHHGDGLEPTPLRGNVPTRVRKLGEGAYEAIVLAAAGVSRLGIDLSGFAVFALNPLVWVPAPGQGTIAIQCREDDAEVRARLAAIEHVETRRRVDTERLLLQAFEAGCSSPFGAFLDGARLIIGEERKGRFLVARTELSETLTLEGAHRLLPSLEFKETRDAVVQPV
ncbi:MAG: hydroxymethylbilane synthase [Myxococcaceae bacterium]|nr:hydroxymethylbilane synthase [Myxococcaceae bacterium]